MLCLPRRLKGAGIEHSKGFLYLTNAFCCRTFDEFAEHSAKSFGHESLEHELLLQHLDLSAIVLQPDSGVSDDIVFGFVSYPWSSGWVSFLPLKVS